MLGFLSKRSPDEKLSRSLQMMEKKIGKSNPKHSEKKLTDASNRLAIIAEQTDVIATQNQIIKDEVSGQALRQSEVELEADLEKMALGEFAKGHYKECIDLIDSEGWIGLNTEQSPSSQPAGTIILLKKSDYTTFDMGGHTGKGKSHYIKFLPKKIENSLRELFSFNKDELALMGIEHSFSSSGMNEEVRGTYTYKIFNSLSDLDKIINT